MLPATESYTQILKINDKFNDKFYKTLWNTLKDFKELKKNCLTEPPNNRKNAWMTIGSHWYRIIPETFDFLVK